MVLGVNWLKTFDAVILTTRVTQSGYLKQEKVGNFREFSVEIQNWC